MLVYTTKMRNMSIEEWIKEREQRGHMTFYVSEIQETFNERSIKGINTELQRLSNRGRIISVYRGF